MIAEYLKWEISWFHTLLCTSDPRWDQGIRKPNRLLGYDLNITTFLILLELRIADTPDSLNAPEHHIILVRYGPTGCNIRYYS